MREVKESKAGKMDPSTLQKDNITVCETLYCTPSEIYDCAVWCQDDSVTLISVVHGVNDHVAI